MSIRLLVCGGRSYSDRDHVYRTLDAIAEKYPINTLIHGACHTGFRTRPDGYCGADGLADDWALERGIEVKRCPVDHELDGPWPWAGPRRNSRMLIWGWPEFGVAFPGKKGTRDMIRQFNAWPDKLAPMWIAP